MLELAIWLYHIGTPDLAVRIATDVATALFLLWGILEDGGESQTGYVG